MFFPCSLLILCSWFSWCNYLNIEVCMFLLISRVQSCITGILYIPLFIFWEFGLVSWVCREVCISLVQCWMNLLFNQVEACQYHFLEVELVCSRRNYLMSSHSRQGRGHVHVCRTRMQSRVIIALRFWKISSLWPGAIGFDFFRNFLSFMYRRSPWY